MTLANTLDMTVIMERAVEESRRYRRPKDVLRAWVYEQNQRQISDETTTNEEWASLAAHFVKDLGTYWYGRDPQVIDRLAYVIAYGSSSPLSMGRTWTWPGGAGVAILDDDVDVENAFRVADLLWHLGVPSGTLLARNLQLGH